MIEAPAEAAALQPESFDAVVNVASSRAQGGYPGALIALRGLVRPGGGDTLGFALLVLRAV